MGQPADQHELLRYEALVDFGFFVLPDELFGVRGVLACDARGAQDDAQDRHLQHSHVHRGPAVREHVEEDEARDRQRGRRPVEDLRDAGQVAGVESHVVEQPP